MFPAENKLTLQDKKLLETALVFGNNFILTIHKGIKNKDNQNPIEFFFMNTKIKKKTV